MVEITKTLEQWEKERGFLTIDRNTYPADKIMNSQEIDLLMHETPNAVRGVNHKDRVKFLKDNGYKINHENMINPELSAKPTK